MWWYWNCLPPSQFHFIRHHIFPCEQTSVTHWRSGGLAPWKILIKNQLDALISQINFWNKTLTCFGQFSCPSSGVFHCTQSNGICHTGLLTACEQDQDGVPSWSYSHAIKLGANTRWNSKFHLVPVSKQTAVSVWQLYVQSWTPDGGWRDCPKHVECHS